MLYYGIIYMSEGNKPSDEEKGRVVSFTIRLWRLSITFSVKFKLLNR